MSDYPLLITIPSKGRAGKVTSHRLLQGGCLEYVKLFVPQAEAQDYALAHPEIGVVPVPDTIKGITPTRNFILDFCAGHDIRWNLQIDDDALYFNYFEGGIGTPGIALPDERKLDLLVTYFEMCEDLGTNLFGFNVSGDKKFYREYSPFSMLSVVVGNLMGIVVDDQRFDERLKVKEDYDFSLQSLHRHRKIIRSNKYVWRVEHHDTEGGCKSYRTLQVEKDAIEILRQKWGKKIVRPHFRKGEYEIRVQVPLNGI